MWINPPCVQPIAPFWIGVLCFALGFFIVSALAAMGIFEPIVDALKCLVRRVKVSHLVLAPGVAALVTFGSTKPVAPPVIVEKGIKLTKCVQTSRKIDFEWVSEDDRIAPGAKYYVQELVEGKWLTVAETTDQKYLLEGFLIDRTRRYRIVSDVTEAANEE